MADQRQSPAQHDFEQLINLYNQGLYNQGDVLKALQLYYYMLVRGSHDEEYKKQLNADDGWKSIAEWADKQLGVRLTDKGRFDSSYINSVKQKLVEKYTAKEHRETLESIKEIVPEAEGVLKKLKRKRKKSPLPRTWRI